MMKEKKWEAGDGSFTPLPDDKSIRVKLMEAGCCDKTIPLVALECFAKLVSNCSELPVSSNMLIIILSQAIACAVTLDCFKRKVLVTTRQKQLIDAMLGCGPRFINALIGDGQVADEAKQLWAKGHASEITYDYLDCSALTAE